MPQVGWFDPSTQRRVLFDDAIEEAQVHGDAFGYPLEVLTGMRAQLEKVRPDVMTVTTLLSNPRHVKLERANDYFATPDSNFATYRGSIIHQILEDNADAESDTEIRMSRTFNGVEISGQPDSVRIRRTNGRTLLRDWKSTKELPRYDNAYSNHQQQVNLYRWLLELDPTETDLEIVYISMEGVKIVPLKHGGRSVRGRAITEQHWDDSKVEAFIQERLALHQVQPILRYEDIPEDDMWMCAYSPVENLCRRLAAREAREAWEQGRDVKQIPPREGKR